MPNNLVTRILIFNYIYSINFLCLAVVHPLIQSTASGSGGAVGWLAQSACSFLGFSPSVDGGNFSAASAILSERKNLKNLKWGNIFMADFRGKEE